jgi:hypothetical protein
MTAAQIRASAVTVLTSLGLQPQNWATGGIASSTLTAASNVLAALSTQLSNAIAQQWNPTASGGGLQLLSQYFYGITPPQATFASGSVVLTNTGGGVYSYGAGQATFGSTVANTSGLYPQYTNSASFTLNANSSDTVPVTCTTIGSAGNSNPGFVTLLVTQMLGVSCTNPNPILGIDGLTDAALRTLNTNSLGVRGSAYGPRSAYAYAISVAVNSVTGLPVNVNRQSISVSSHTGAVTIYVASPEGTVSTTDLEGISNSIEALARPDGVTVLPGLPGYPSAPASATVVNYTAAIVVYVAAPSGVTTSGLQTLVTNALSTWFEGPTNPIGGLTASDDTYSNFTGIFESGVIGLIGAAVASSPGCVLLSTKFGGSGDLALVAGEVAAWAPSVPVQINVQVVN